LKLRIFFLLGNAGFIRHVILPHGPLPKNPDVAFLVVDRTGVVRWIGDYKGEAELEKALAQL